MGFARSFSPVPAVVAVLLLGGGALAWGGWGPTDVGDRPGEDAVRIPSDGSPPGEASSGAPREGDPSAAAPFAWLVPDGGRPVEASGQVGSVPPGAPLAAGVPQLPGASLQQGMQDYPRPCMPWKASGPPREFHFTRGIYSSGGGGGFFGRGRRGAWCTDHPKAEEQFLAVLDRLTGIDAHPLGNAVRLDDPDLRRYPVLYMLEVGAMGMTREELEGLRSYLLAGGFLIIDDFWGTREWFNFEREMARLFPEYPIVELPMDHPVYRTYYQVDTVLQVPAVNRAWGGPTWERDGYHARNFGIFDDDGRLLVAINWNTDLGDAWEWMEQPHYPLRLSTYAYQVGVNYIVYAMSY